MRTLSRLRLLLFSVNDNSVGSSIFVLIALSNLEQAHHKDSSNHYVVRNNYSRYLYGGPEGICTPVQNYFLLTSYDHTNWRLTNLSPMSSLNRSASFNVLKIIKNVAKEPDLYLTLYIIYTLISKAHLWIIL
jgi:hypothetical protein